MMLDSYFEKNMVVLEKIRTTQRSKIETAARMAANTIEQDGIIYMFGCGHSHLIALDNFYRAGGLACVYPILESGLMLHEGASKSSSYERLEGVGNAAVSHTPLGKGDVLFLISNSGRNCAVIDAALEARKRGAITVAITSMNHTTSVTSRHPNGLNLYQVCDFVLDNGGAVGDASVALKGLKQQIAPTSSVIDITLVNLVLVNTVELLLQKGTVPPIFTSANTDEGDSANRSILQTYRPRIPSL